MNTEDFNAIILDQLENSKEMLIKKSEEYATDTDRLHNFRQAAHLSGESMVKALAGMMVKHTVSIYDMINNPDTFYDMDVWNEKITDHINYLLLLRAVVIEEKHKVNKLAQAMSAGQEYREQQKELAELQKELAELRDAQALQNLKEKLTSRPSPAPSKAPEDDAGAPPTKVIEIPIVSEPEEEDDSSEDKIVVHGTAENAPVVRDGYNGNPRRFEKYRDGGDGAASSVPSFLQDNTQTARLDRI